MTTYLLLRNNKESGPFQLEQLKEMGLKPYDLIWVSGKSAAWRYSGEVEELKEFAPIVEEQPFDRFYKKPEPNKEKHFHEIVEEAEKNKTAIKEETIKTEIISESVPVSPKKVINNPKIYVSMPEQATPAAVTIPNKINKIPEEKIIEQIDQQKSFVQTVPVTEKPETAFQKLRNKYSEAYKTGTENNNKVSSIKKILEVSVAALFLITLGTLIYLNFKPGNTTPIVKAVPENNNLSEPVSQLQTAEQNLNAFTKNDELSEQISASPEGKSSAIPFQKGNNSSETNIAKADPVTNPDDTKAVSSQTNIDGQRQKSVRENDVLLKEEAADISKQVSVKANEYKRRGFGGIENLQLTVVNSSDYILDKVIVELQYLKPSEQPLKTEKIEFTTIAPNGSMTLKIPDSPRGIKVTYKITHVVSGQYGKGTVSM